MRKITIVGANSQVGTELSFLLRNEDGIKIIPVVRSFNATAFFHRNGLKCVVADISDLSDAVNTIGECDLIVLAAFASGPPKSSRLINEALIINVIKYSNKDVKIIYLSSIAAFGGQGVYTLEKRHTEKLFHRMCKRYRKKGYVFRLGHVFGINQSWTPRVLEILKINGVVKFKVNSNLYSNILHTVTLKEAILKCLYEELPARRYYSIVNNPQWTWQDVFEHYAKGHNISIEFEQDEKRDVSKKRIFIEKALLALSKYVTPNLKCQTIIRALLIYLPKNIELRAQAVNFKQRALKEINDISSSKTVSIDIFDIKPMPGPFLPGLESTRNMLKEYILIKDIFLLPDYLSRYLL